MLVMFTDTDCDVTKKQAEQLGVKLISMPYIVDGKEVRPYVDFDEFDSKTFYDMLRQGTLPQTCALNPDQYVEIFEPYYKNGDDILYVHFSTAMTGSFNAMHLAIDALSHSYPNTKFYEIDTKGITILGYNIAMEAIDMYRQGKSAEEIVAWADTEVDRFAIYFYADDLKFFAKSGRVSNFKAAMGNLVGVHPILNMASDGMMKQLGSATGRIKTLRKIVDYVEELGDDIKHHRIIIGHSDCLDVAQKMESLLKERFGDDLQVEYVTVNPTAGSHCGPDGIGVCFHAKHR